MHWGAGAAGVSTRMSRTGRVLSAVVVLFMLFDGLMKLIKIQPVVHAMTELGYPDDLTVSIGALGLACTLLYAVPRTSVLGAILLTGYFGGAAAAKLRLEDPWLFFSVGMGILTWGGLFFRDEQLRALIPLRTSAERLP